MVAGFGHKGRPGRMCDSDVGQPDILVTLIHTIFIHALIYKAGVSIIWHVIVKNR